MCSGLGKRRERGCECVCGCVCVSSFHSPTGPEPSFGMWGSGSHPLPAAPTPGPLGQPLFPEPGLGFTPPLELASGEHLKSSPSPRPMSVPPSLAVRRERVTLQVSRRVQIFLVSGFITPHCLLRSHSFPVGKVVPVSPQAISRGPMGGKLGLRRRGPPTLQSEAAGPLPERDVSGCQRLFAGHENHPRPHSQPRHSFWGLQAPNRATHIKTQKQSQQISGMPGKSAGGRGWCPGPR